LRILLDENIPVQLKAVFHGHEVRSVNDKDVGWKNIKNGQLLTQMEGRFDLLITADHNIYAQQNLSGRGFASSCCRPTGGGMSSRWESKS
jgi:predicted nuclease of predicted toxin-antitoxin system